MFTGITLLASASSIKRTRLQQQQQKRTKVPPRFGTSVASFTTSISSPLSDSILLSSKENREDCPICKRYSQGPCGDVFKQWMACTDAHPGKDETTGEDLHLSKCLDLAKKLGSCLNKHQEFYEALDLYRPEEDEEVESMEELQAAWQKVIEEIEETRIPKPFASLSPPLQQPTVEVNPKQQNGFVALPLERSNSCNLIMVYARCDTTKEILAAGSNEDLWEWKDGLGILRLSFNSTTKSITTYALYEDADNDDVLLEHRLILKA
eukprot:CAMPEP_0202455360 /NCGR_PEP_ID=MMETSP1360-20130828/12912_1 /ASSEMBLY_ACC=CAM_ASM_000848 /TAXON_ID=515479 /ORGANISM="Licmophora paradoxa, Strain CCMP2313" /LENGTH=264 /DNA_ID=CAMNT_0049074927 /DNA_START=365 /DNA_END=1159 /DNA_ORIENTATION=+